MSDFPDTDSLPMFIPFPKSPRLSRTMIVTEKLDGTNAQIYINKATNTFMCGSRNRWITVGDDNYGFAAWAMRNRDDLMTLGDGRHFGEWWGKGIQRGYDLEERRFSLFNVVKWENNLDRPRCCHVVPTLYHGDFNTGVVIAALAALREQGSYAAPGFMQPEGVMVFHAASGVVFKKTLENDEQPKGAVK